MRILKIFPLTDHPMRYNYDINYGVWDCIKGDSTGLENFDADLNEYDVVFIPMRSRWYGYGDLLQMIKDHKIKKVLFDNDSCYRSFDDDFYTGMDYIFYRGPDKNGETPENGSVLLWSVNEKKYTPIYGGYGVISPGTVNDSYKLRKEIEMIVKHERREGAEYIEYLQQASAAIHTNSDRSTIVRAKVLEFAACGTQIISNRCDNMEDYFPDELIVYFESVEHLEKIVEGFRPDLGVQIKLRAIVEQKHTNDIRAKQILELI